MLDMNIHQKKEYNTLSYRKISLICCFKKECTSPFCIEMIIGLKVQCCNETMSYAIDSDENHIGNKLYEFAVAV